MVRKEKGDQDQFRDHQRSLLRVAPTPSPREGDAGAMKKLRLLLVGNVWEWSQGMDRTRSNPAISCPKTHGEDGMR